MMMVTICLIAVVGVGATLAYLTDSTDVLKNTFTLGKVDIEIGEPDWKGNPENIVPGQSFAKNPTVTVMANSVDSYVFMSVKGIDIMEANGFLIDDINSAWKKVENDTDGKDGIYYYVDADGEAAIVTEPSENEKNEDGSWDLPALFTTVTYDSNTTEITETTPLKYEIFVKAAAVQAKVMNGETEVQPGSTFEEALDAVRLDLVDFSKNIVEKTKSN